MLPVLCQTIRAGWVRLLFYLILAGRFALIEVALVFVFLAA